MKAEVKKNIDVILEKYKGENFDICYQLYNIISGLPVESEEQTEAFQYICEKFGMYESDDSIAVEPCPFSRERETLKNKYGKLVVAILETYLKENCEDKEFYASLWKGISAETIFDNTEKKVFAFYYILIDKRIPYFKLMPEDKYSMSNERFRKLREKYFKEAQRINFIQRNSFQQKTERASTLLSELGIHVPGETESRAEVEEYEKKLIQMTEIIKSVFEAERKLERMYDIVGE